MNKKTNRALYLIIMTVVIFIWAVPIIWMFSLSLTPNDVLQRTTANLIPPQWTIENFGTALRVGDLPRWFLNSSIVTIFTTVITVMLCSAAGYAFARINFRGKKIVYPFVLAGLMVPKEAMFIPLFLMFANLDMQNTYAALILPRVAAPLGVFIMTQFFKAIPHEIEEAAQIDGASRFTIFWKIMLPMSVPAMTALAIFTFILSWNDYLWPLVIATKKEMFTLTTGLASLQGNFAQATELGSLMARGVIAIAPLLILFLVFQRNLIRGISVSSGGK